MQDWDDLQEAAYESGLDIDWADWGLQLGQVIQPGSDNPPTSDYGRWVQTQGEIPKEETPGSGWPQAVPMRPANWNMDTDPDSYKVAWGDTYAGLAATYLGTPMRWREIWNEQPDEYRYSHSPDVLYPNEWLFMPQDASATLRAALGEPPEPGDKPAPPPPGGYPAPVGPKPAPGALTENGDDKKKWLPYVIGGGILAAVAVVALG